MGLMLQTSVCSSPVMGRADFLLKITAVDEGLGVEPATSYPCWDLRHHSTQLHRLTAPLNLLASGHSFKQCPPSLYYSLAFSRSCLNFRLLGEGQNCTMSLLRLHHTLPSLPPFPFFFLGPAGIMHIYLMSPSPTGYFGLLVSQTTALPRTPVLASPHLKGIPEVCVGGGSQRPSALYLLIINFNCYAAAVCVFVYLHVCQCIREV